MTYHPPDVPGTAMSLTAKTQRQKITNSILYFCSFESITFAIIAALWRLLYIFFLTLSDTMDQLVEPPVTAATLSFSLC